MSSQSVRRVMPVFQSEAVEESREFYGLLGFEEEKAVVISGPQFATYMGVDGMEADHVTLVLAGATSAHAARPTGWRPSPARSGYG